MKKIIEHSIFLCLVSLAFPVKSQYNLVPNGDFETGGTPSCVYDFSYNYNLDNWLWTRGSYDWIDYDYYILNCPTHHPFPSTILSNRFVGFYANKRSTYSPDDLGLPDVAFESISVKLRDNLSSNSTYFLSFKTCLVPFDGSLDNTNYTFEVILSEKANWWTSSGNIRKIINFELNPDNQYSWVDINKESNAEFSFQIPWEDANKIEYIAITGRGDSYSNTNGYVYIDDVKLYTSCNHPCTPPEISQPLEFRDHVPAHYNALVINHNPWWFYVTNATGIEFDVWDRWGGNIFHRFDYDPNGLVDPGYNDFEYTFIWNGYDYSGQALPEYIYSYTLKIWNCDPANDYNILINTSGNTIQVIGDPDHNSPTFIPTHFTEIFNADCCPGGKTLIGCTNYHAGYLVSDYIDAYNYIIPSVGIIYFDAGQTIHLGNGFHATNGCYFNAKCVGCIPEKKASIVSKPADTLPDFLSDYETSVLRVHPNPFLDNFNVSFVSEKEQIIHIALFDVYGHEIKILFDGVLNSPIGFWSVYGNDLSSGVYIVVLKSSSQIIESKKIIKL